MYSYTLRSTILAFFILCSRSGWSQLDELQLRDLRGDSLLSLNEYKNPILVLVFDQFDCPYVAEYASRMDSIAKEYSAKGVQFVYVNANSDDFKHPDFRKLVRARFVQLHPSIPYVADKYAKYMYTLNVKKAPEVAVLIKKTKNYEMVYIGGIDDSPLEEEDIRNPYLKKVLNALLSGKTVKPHRQRTAGCMIKRD